MKKFVILLAFIFSVLSIGNLYANSNVGHNTIAIYCIWRMTIDPNFMPEIQGQDRHELTHPEIWRCKEWDDLSDVQMAFLQGVNLPDCLSFMQYSHNEAPMEILSAMYILKDFCAPAFKHESKNDKAYICRMQRFMTWGSKLHIEMDKITHAKLPYAGTEMDKHVRFERIWDLFLLNDILNEIYNSHSIDPSTRPNLVALSDCIDAWDSPNMKKSKFTFIHYGGFDIRDEYVNFILEKYGKKGAFKNGSVALMKKDNLKGLMGIVASWGDKDKKFEDLMAQLSNEGYPYPKNLPGLMINLVNHINLTVGPTQQEIAEQYDIDVPESMPKKIIGPTPQGQGMLERVRQLRK